MEQGKNDFWGFKTQGQNYEKYRSHYPKELIDKVIKVSEGKKAYLDIATGTGIVLFQVYKYFSDICVGNDLSETMMTVANGNLKEIKEREEKIQPKIELINCDFFSLIDELKTRELSVKFDVVTIASALHWFEHDKLIEYLNTNLLQSDGSLCVIGTFQRTFEYNVSDVEFRKKITERYEKYGAMMRPYNKGNPNKNSATAKGYEYIDFSKYYKNVKNELIVESRPSKLDDIFGLVKTISTYNCYVKENANKPDFKDPADELRECIEKDLKEYSEKTGEKINECPIMSIITYQFIECSNK